MSATEIIAALRQSLDDGSFVKLSLADYKGDETDLKQIHVRRVTVKRTEKLGFTYRYKTRDIAKNYDIAEGLDKIDNALRTGFRRAALFTTAFDLILENGKIRKGDPTETAPPDTAHDHQKSRAIKTANQSWLHDLNITDATGKIHDSAQDKYRQINRYVELLAPHIAAPPGGKTMITRTGFAG